MANPATMVSLQTLRDLLIEEARFLWGVRDQVEEVRRQLSTIHAFLMDADNISNRQDSATLRDWIASLEDLISEAENVLEKYTVEVASRREGRSLRTKLKRYACIFCECCSVHQVRTEAEAVQSHLANLTARARLISGGEGSSNPPDEDERHLLRIRYAHEVEQHFVGMEKDVENLVSMVKGDERASNMQAVVISICGMGGLGKTTLARKIYNHEVVKVCFEARAWVCATQQFNAKYILSEILRQFLPDDKKQISNLGVRELVGQIYSAPVAQKKYLVVIDDIWEIPHWDILKPAFPTNCTVLLTTRNENIASIDCTVYRLDFLTEDEGWELLQKVAFSTNNARVPQGGEVVGRRMVQKCGRLPLAISAVGGILHGKSTLSEWEDVDIMIDSKLRNGEGVDRNHGVDRVLGLSYSALPYFLKPCFLYLGCFPEDQKIDTEKLYLLWIAEGFISSQDKGSNETLRNVAERYLTELAFRCMVEVDRDDIHAPRNRFRSCHLHDLMRDFCLKEGRKDSFLEVVSFSENGPSSIDATTIRRLAICVEDDDAATLSIDRMRQFEHLRSLLVLHQKRNPKGLISFQDSMVDFERSRCFRIIVLDRCRFESEKLPSKVEKLIHLRYLSLFKSYVKKLPSSIFEMPYLQTLDLRVSNIIKLPNVIYKMKSLRNLFLDKMDVIGGDKLILDGLKELETLERIRSDKVRIADISKLRSLRKVDIEVRDMNSASVVADHISNHRSLDARLSVGKCNFSSGEGGNVFKSILMSPSLLELEIDRCCFEGGFPRKLARDGWRGSCKVVRKRLGERQQFWREVAGEVWMFASRIGESCARWLVTVMSKTGGARVCPRQLVGFLLKYGSWLQFESYLV